MTSSYKRLGDYIQEVKKRNTDLKVTNLIGLSTQKEFRISISNIIGTDLNTYKIIEQNNFVYMPVTDTWKGLAVALYRDNEPKIVSQIYKVFEIVNPNLLDPEYLMMWFKRNEIDRYARFKSHGSAREIFDWQEMCDVMLPIPSPEKQQQIVNEYHTLQKRIDLNNQLIAKLEETAQTIYKQWFVEGIDLENLPEGWRFGKLFDIASIVMGQSPEGESYNINGEGTPLINGPVEFGDYFTVKTKWTTEPKKYCKKGDLIFCVRGSTVGKKVIADDKYAIGRGVCAISSKYQLYLIQLVNNHIDEILKDVTGSTFPNIDRVTLGNYPIIISSEEMIKDFENKANSFNKIIRSKVKENQKLEELKELLLGKMAKGD